MTCKHENAEHMMPGGSSTPDWCVQFYAECEQFRCIDCGAWLSLGPANDRPKSVRMEARAAELANSPKNSWCTNDAWSGWHAHEMDWEPFTSLESEAGYLARVIATHGGNGE